MCGAYVLMYSAADDDDIAGPESMRTASPRYVTRVQSPCPTSMNRNVGRPSMSSAVGITVPVLEYATTQYTPTAAASKTAAKIQAAHFALYPRIFGKLFRNPLFFLFILLLTVCAGYVTFGAIFVNTLCERSESRYAGTVRASQRSVKYGQICPRIFPGSAE